MAFKLTGIADYVKQNADELIAKGVLAPKTMGLVTVQSGIKYKDSVNFLGTEVKFQDGSSCGFSAQGTSEISQKEIEVAPIKVNMSWCEKALTKTIFGLKLKTAAGQEELPFEAELMADINKHVQRNIDMALWKGDKTSTDVNLKNFNGFLKLIKDSTSTIQPANTKAINAANVEGLIKLAMNAIPDRVLADAVIFVGIDTYRLYQEVLVGNNMYHFAGGNLEAFDTIIPGTNIHVIGLEALNGTKSIVACNPNTLIAGTDMENDEEVYDFWYSKDADEFRLKINFKLGAQLMYDDEIVMVTGA